MQVDTRIVEETVRSILEKNGAQVATGKRRNSAPDFGYQP